MKGTNRLRKPGSVKKHLLGRVHSVSEVYDYIVRQTQEDINKGLNKRIEEVAQSATEVISKGTTALSDMEYGKMYLDEENDAIFVPINEPEGGIYKVLEFNEDGIFLNKKVDSANQRIKLSPRLTDLTQEERASLKGDKGDKGDQGDSAVYDPSSPDAPDFVMANTIGQSTTKAMTQKAVTDGLETKAAKSKLIESGSGAMKGNSGTLNITTGEIESSTTRYYAIVDLSSHLFDKISFNYYTNTNFGFILDNNSFVNVTGSYSSGTDITIPVPHDAKEFRISWQINTVGLYYYYTYEKYRDFSLTTEVLTVMSFIGTGNTLATSTPMNVLPSHKYRIYVPTNISMSGVTSTGARFNVLAKQTENTTIYQAVSVLSIEGYSSPLQDYYDVTIPSNCIQMVVGGRCANGVQFKVLIEDITLFDSYLPRPYSVDSPNRLINHSINEINKKIVPITSGNWDVIYFPVLRGDTANVKISYLESRGFSMGLYLSIEDQTAAEEHTFIYASGTHIDETLNVTKDGYVCFVFHKNDGGTFSISINEKASIGTSSIENYVIDKSRHELITQCAKSYYVMTRANQYQYGKRSALYYPDADPDYDPSVDVDINQVHCGGLTALLASGCTFFASRYNNPNNVNGSYTAGYGFDFEAYSLRLAKEGVQSEIDYIGSENVNKTVSQLKELMLFKTSYQLSSACLRWNMLEYVQTGSNVNLSNIKIGDIIFYGNANSGEQQWIDGHLITPVLIEGNLITHCDTVIKIEDGMPYVIDAGAAPVRIHAFTKGNLFTYVCVGRVPLFDIVI